MKKPSEGKAPITGRTARERAKARAASAAGAERAEKERQEAIKTRSRVVVGETAEKLAPELRMVRQLIARAMQGSGQPDVRARLRELSGGEDELGAPTDYLTTWDFWQRLRVVDQKLDSAWAAIETLLETDPQASDHVFEELCAQVDILVSDWEGMMGIEHPVGRLMRVTSPKAR